MSNKFALLCLVLVLLMYLAKCQPNGNFPGREYMPDMAHSRAYDVYTSGPGSQSDILKESGDQQLDYKLFKNGMSARVPVEGTIPRGHEIYSYAVDTNGYNLAGATHENPFWDADAKALEEGKYNYTIYCAVCHGEKGQGGGSISAMSGGPYGGIPNYFGDAYIQMEEGKMFHSVHYGKADMGSYASQLTKEERWKVISYIKKMQADHVKGSKGFDDATAMNYVRNKRVALSPSGKPIVSALSKMKKQKLEKGKTIVLENVFFDSGRFDLREESYYELNILKEILQNNSNALVEISGHTDSDGNANSNQVLSQNRAKAAFDYLVSQGIMNSQISFKGYGQNVPVAPNDTPENKQKNRRTEFKVLDLL